MALASRWKVMIELYNPQALKISIGDPTSVERTFARIEGVLGEVNVLLYNVGAGMFEDVETITPDQFGQAWRVNAYGALLCAARPYAEDG
jgi:NAD(P)-dependent dehydrogenase (short-subunit alcohol dehydrogenase family)